MTGHKKEHLVRWDSFAESQKRMNEVIQEEIHHVSEDVEKNILNLNDQFKNLASAVNEQTSQLTNIIALVKDVKVDGEDISLENVAEFLEETLKKIINEIIFFSKQAMKMIYSLDDVLKNVEAIEKCIGDIESINSTTNFVALNARIEAIRAGEAGSTFVVVANEIRDLSTATNELAEKMRNQIDVIVSGMKGSHTILQELATVDMSTHILSKDRLDSLMEGIVNRNQELSGYLSSAAETSESVSASISRVVMDMQFQDRAKQKMDHIIESMDVMMEAIKEIKADVRAENPGIEFTEQLDEEWVHELLNKFTLAEVQKRFIERLLLNKCSDTVREEMEKEAEQEHEIELF